MKLRHALPRVDVQWKTGVKVTEVFGDLVCLGLHTPMRLEVCVERGVVR